MAKERFQWFESWVKSIARAITWPVVLVFTTVSFVQAIQKSPENTQLLLVIFFLYLTAAIITLYFEFKRVCTKNSKKKG